MYMSLVVKINLYNLLKTIHLKCWQQLRVPLLMDKIHRRIPAELMAASNRSFSGQRAPDGTPWQERSPAYVQHLRRKGLAGRKILTITSHLRKSRQAFRDGNRSGVGTNLVYAAIHQFGGPAGRGHKSRIPARPYLGLDDYSKNKLDALVHKLVMQHFKN